jgi:hypothetical protein
LGKTHAIPKFTVKTIKKRTIHGSFLSTHKVYPILAQKARALYAGGASILLEILSVLFFFSIFSRRCRYMVRQKAAPPSVNRSGSKLVFVDV